MSELKQEKKTLSFEEICPTWARRIANYDNLTDDEQYKIGRLLVDTKLCFVGEAHGNDNYFDCEECYGDFSHFNTRNGLCHGWNNKQDDWKEFNRRKDAFVKHFNEVHVNG